MGELSDAAIDAALARGRAARAAEPRAVGVRFDPEAGRVIVDLVGGCTFAFPPSLVEDLAGASEAELAEVEVLGAGYGLHWERLDVDLTVPGLLAGICGTAAFMARRAGSTTSPAKAAAARVNGAKGGRPRRSAATDA